MFLNKNKEVNEIYLDDAPPILFLHPKNDKNFQKYYKKINDKLKKEYNIEPKIIALEKKIEDEFQDRKNLQLKLNTKINEEKKLQNKYNQTTSKKSHITPPKYTFKKHQLSPKLNQNYYDKNNELKLDKNENKSTKTIFSKDTFFFRAMTPTKNIFELNLKNRKNFSSEQKTLQNNVSTNLSDLTKLKSAVQFCSENKYKTSEKLNKLLIPKDINKILLEAKNLIIKKKFKNAETILANLIRREIKHADLFYLMGEAKRLIGEFEIAEEMFLRSLKFEMHSPFCYYSLALVYMELRNFQRAINLWKIFVKIKDNNALGYFELAKCYFEIESYVEAASSLNNAIDLDSRDPFFFLLRAEAFELLNLEESSKKDYKRFKNLLPNFSEKYEVEIKKLEEIGLFEDALKLKKIVNKIKKL